MERDAKTCGVKIKAFHADNGIFKSTQFRLELKNNDQNITFCGVGAHHQNGVSEMYIRTMVVKARTILLNTHARWSDMIDMELWTFAFRHVVTKWNNTPHKELNCRTPEEAFNRMSRVKKIKNHFANFHPFGIPVYILDHRLQDNRKIPK